MSKNSAGINVSASGSDGAPGAPGADGADGKTILYGTAAPTTEGVDGDTLSVTGGDLVLPAAQSSAYFKMFIPKF